MKNRCQSVPIGDKIRIPLFYLRNEYLVSFLPPTRRFIIYRLFIYVFKHFEAVSRFILKLFFENNEVEDGAIQVFVIIIRVLWE